MIDFLLMVGGALFAMIVSGIVNYKKSAWVGLTDEEKSLFSSWLDHKTDDEVFSAIEAKLKEKNT